MSRWSSIIVVLAGIWTAGIPFFGPLIGFSSMSGMHMMGGPLVDITGSTIWYHLLPGVVTITAGVYQLAAPLRLHRGALEMAQQPTG